MNEQPIIVSSNRDLKTILGMNVNRLMLSTRTSNVMDNACIETIGQLVSKTEREMKQFRNFGPKCLREIKSGLDSIGLKLGMSEDDKAKLIAPKQSSSTDWRSKACLTLKEAAVVLSCPASQLRKLGHRGVINPITAFGNKWRIDVRDIDRLLATRLRNEPQKTEQEEKSLVISEVVSSPLMPQSLLRQRMDQTIGNYADTQPNNR